jgi:hypothetical protein
VPAARIDRATTLAQVSMSFGGVADHGGLARGAGGGVDARHPIARHGEHAERVVVAQVLLHGEGELREVVEVLQIVGMHAGGVEGLPVMRRRWS